MTFQVAPLEMRQCDARCPHMIIADDIIERETPLVFVSACVYAMIGAVKRVASPGSKVSLHRMSVVETEGEPSGTRRSSREAMPTR